MRAFAEHVVVGDDVAVGRDDDAGAEARRVALARAEHAFGIAEELLEERIVEERRRALADDLDRRDVGHGADGLFGDAREVRPRRGGDRRRRALRCAASARRTPPAARTRDPSLRMRPVRTMPAIKPGGAEKDEGEWKDA